MDEIFIQNKIYNLTGDDFYLDTPSQLVLKEKRHILILFTDDTESSKYIYDIWIDISRKISNILLGVINLENENNIKVAIDSIKSNIYNPFRKILPNIYPSIVLYIDGYPQNIVTCEYDLINLLDYCLTIF